MAADSVSSASRSKAPAGKITEAIPFATLGKNNQTVWEPGLPAEVVSRRVHKPAKKVVEKTDGEAALVCDLKATLKMSADAKMDWLREAVTLLAKRKTRSQEVYNIIAHPKFVAGIPLRIGQKMFRCITDGINNFSDRQQRGLLSQSRFAELFSPTGTGEVVEYDDESELSEEERELEQRRQAKKAAEREQLQREAREHEEQQRVAAEQKRAEEEERKRKEVARDEAAKLQKEEDKAKEEARRKAEADRKAAEEKERQRKEKIGKAFLLEDEDDEPRNKKVSMLEAMRRRDLKASDLVRPEDIVPDASTRSAAARASNPWAVDAMGGDRVLNEAHEILKRAGGFAPRDSKRDRSSGRRSRSRRRHSRSRSGNRRVQGSTRSPTPDGRARGQMRAARKAKMMASILGAPPPLKR